VDPHPGRRTRGGGHWWFTSFAILRNKIAHGGVIAAEEYEFEGVHHVFHGELHLRRAIKKVVADAGHEDVLLGPFERIARRYEVVLSKSCSAMTSRMCVGCCEP